MQFKSLLLAWATAQLASAATTVTFRHNKVWAQEVDNNWKDTGHYAHTQTFQVRYGKVKVWIDGTNCGPYYYQWPANYGDVILNDNGCMMQSDNINAAGHNECHICLAQH